MAYTPGMQGDPTLAQGYSVSPFLGAQIGQLGQQFNQNLQRNTLPAIRQGAIAAGGVGGSRQGIAEGIAAGDSASGFANAATNLLGNDYQAQMARNLQKYQGDQSYNLGLGNLDLGMTNANNTRYGMDQTYNLGMTNAGNTADRNRNDFYTQQRQGDLYQQNIGADMYNNALRTQAAAGAAGQGGGFNWQQALGGAIGGTQLWNNLNKPTTNTSSTSSTGWW